MSNTSVGQIGLDLKLNSSNIQSQLQNAVKNPLKNVNKTVSGSLTSGFKKLGKAVVAAFAVQKVVQFGKACIDLGSDLAEVQNVVDVTFGKGANTINAWAKTTAKAYGVSELSAKQYSGTMGAMLKSMGLSSDAAMDMSMNLAGLAGDLASFYNLDTDEAFTKIRSGISGETEPLKQLGINMSVVNLEAYAMSQGITKSFNAMSQSEKALLRYNYLLSVTSDAQGDFSRTSGGWANQVRILKLNFDSLKATIGQLLINCLLPLVKMLNGVIEATNKAASAVADFFGISNQASGGAGAAAIAASTGDASENLEDANSSAKALKKSLAGFDKLNVIGSESSDSGSGGAGSIEATSPTTSSGGVAEEVKKANPLLDQLRAKLKVIAAEFKGGFKIGFNGTSLKNFKSHLSGIKDSVVGIFSDKAVVSSASGFIDNLAKNLGKSVGAISSIGVTVGEFLTGSLEKYLNQHGGRVKEHIVNMFDITGEINDIIGNFHTAVAELFEVFRSDDAKQVGADLLNIFTEPFMTLKETCQKLTRDVTDAITGPFIENLDGIKTAFANTLGSIKKYTGAISRTVSNLCTTVRNTYDEYVAPMFQNIKNGLSKIVGAFTTAYNTYLAPVIDKLATKFGDMWENHIGPAAQKIVQFFGKVCELVGVVWNNWLAPFISWVVSKIVPAIAPIIQKIGSFIAGIGSTIGDVIGGIFSALGGLISFLTGVFSGDWQKAWTGIKDFLKGIWDGIWSIIKGVINLVIDGLNSLWKAVYKVFKGVVDGIGGAVGWVGELFGKDWGFSMPENPPLIPKLAQGGYVEANTPQLAMIGDNRHQGEIIAPEGKITEAVMAALGPIVEVLQQLGTTIRAMANGNGKNIVVQCILDGKVVYETVVKQNNKQVRQTGRSLIKV